MVDQIREIITKVKINQKVESGFPDSYTFVININLKDKYGEPVKAQYSFTSEDEPFII